MSDPNHALSAPLTSLANVTPEVAKALATEFGIKTVGDLARDPTWVFARELLDAVGNPQHDLQRFGLPRGRIVESAATEPIEKLVEASVGVLQGLDDNRVRILENSLGVRTVRDLAGWPPFLAARDLLAIALRDGATTESSQIFRIVGIVGRNSGAPVAGAEIRITRQGLRGPLPLIDDGTFKTNANGGYICEYPQPKTAVDLRVELVANANLEIPETPPWVITRAGVNERADFIVGGGSFRGPSTFDNLSQQLTPSLAAEGLELAEIVEFDEPALARLALTAGVDPRTLVLLRQSYALEQETHVPAAVFFGMGHQKLPLGVTALLSRDSAERRAAVSAALKANVIPPHLEAEAARALSMLDGMTVTEALKQPASAGLTTLGGLLSSLHLDPDKQQKLASTYVAHTGSNAEFWKAVVTTGVLSDAEVEQVQLTLQLAAVTHSHAPLVEALKARGVSKLQDVAALKKSDWGDLIQGTTGSPPVGLPVDFQAAGLSADEYAESIYRVIEDAMPTAMVAARVDHFPEPEPLRKFFVANPGFELRVTPVRVYLEAHPDALSFASDATERNLVVQQLQGIERTYRIAPPGSRLETMEVLLKNGVDSARKVCAQGQAAFLRQYTSPLGEAQARQVWARASQATALAMTVISRHGAMFDQTPMSVLPRRIEQLSQLPSYEEMFGSLDYCSCSECQSVYSPAAYLVELLHWLDNRSATATDKTALDVLFDNRRADLGAIETSCPNTNTPLPYLDLVNETLELLVAPEAPSPAWQTTGQAADLRAHPEHLHRGAYEVLAGARATEATDGQDAIYPFSLPYNLWLDEARTYLRQFGVTRDQLMEATLGAEPARADAGVAAEALGMPVVEWNLITGQPLDPSRSVAACWGLPDATPLVDTLKQVSTLLRQGAPRGDEQGMEFTELTDLLRCDFLQQPATVGLWFDGQTCDTTRAQLTGLSEDTLERMHRMIRLRRRLGWSAADLDRGIQVIGSGALDATCLIRISHVCQLASQLRRPVSEILDWWGPLDTRRWSSRLKRGVPPDAPAGTTGFGMVFNNQVTDSPADGQQLSPCERLFQSPSISTERNPAFDVNSTGQALVDESRDLVEFFSTVASALGIAADDLTTLLPRLPDGKLSLSNLSTLYRHVSLARALNLKIQDLVSLIALTGLDPFDAHTAHALAFLDEVHAARSAEISIAELAVLLRNDQNPGVSVEPSDTEIGLLLFELGAALRKAEIDPPQPTGATNVVVDKLAAFTRLDRGVVEPLLRTYLKSPDAQGRPLLEVFSDNAIRDYNATAATAGGSTQVVLPNADNLPEPFTACRRLCRTATLLNRLRIGPAELDWVLQAGPARGTLNFQSLPVSSGEPPASYTGWARLRQAVTLRNRLANAQLFDLFEAAAQAVADSGTATAAHERLLNELAGRTGWEQTDIEFLVGTPPRGNLPATAGALGFAYPQDWQDERPLARLEEVMRVARLVGVPAATLWSWREIPVPAAATTTAWQQAIDRQISQANEIKQAVRARSAAAQWLETGRRLRDPLRECQRDALVGWLVGNDSRFDDSGSLFEHLLLDVDMSPCQLTSRIRQALSSVQLFVQRLLMGLEVDSDGSPLVVLDSADADEWEWMKNYRVWEANRKVFLYPENWLEPELRDDKTPFFKELEDQLLQGEVTAEAAENAVRGYLEKLDTVARLEVVSQFHQQDPGTDRLHVFGRTRGVPSLYYHRQRVDDSYWTPWEKIELDIEGNHLIPVVFNRRLYLFWPQISEAAVEEEPQQIPAPPARPQPSRPKSYYQIHLAWSQRTGNGWAPRKIAKPFIGQDVHDLVDCTADIARTSTSSPADFLFRTSEEDGDLLIEPIRCLHSQHRAMLARQMGDPGDPTSDHTPPVGPDRPDVFDPGSGQTFEPVIEYLRLQRFRMSGCDGTIVLEPQTSAAVVVRVPSAMFTDGQTFARYRGAGPLTLPAFNPLSLTIGAESMLGHVPAPAEIVPLHVASFDSRDPFFFQDSRRTFYVEPYPYLTWVRGRPDWVVNANVALDLRTSRSAARPRPGLPISDPWVYDSAAVASQPAALRWRAPASPSSAAAGFGLTGIDSRTLSEAFGSRIAFLPGAALPARSTELTLGVGARIVGSKGEDLGTTFAGLPPVAGRDLGRIDLIRTFEMPALKVTPIPFPPFLKPVWRTRYRFEMFYHPYVCPLMRELNRVGLDGIFDPSSTGPDPELVRQQKQNEFFATYQPLSVEEPFPKETFDFSFGGSYAVYNWELFLHIPLLIACRLSQNQKFADAQRWFHSIFDPTETGGEAPQRFWKTRPLFELFLGENATAGPIQELLLLLQYDGSDPARLKQRDDLIRQVSEWRANPFNPHAIARLRLTTFARAVVMKYIDNLINWGDLLFRSDTLESINEATQLYLLAARILGRKPRQVSVEPVAPRTFNDLRGHLNEFSNALVEEVEGLLPDTGDVPGNAPETADGQAVAIAGPMLLFCVPPNDKLLSSYWDRVADRLFKIRHCMNIGGVVRELPLFEPPIDPGLLVRAKALGVDLASVLLDLQAPLPCYRFAVLSQKAGELCNDVRGLGQALLSALEKQDAEELSRLRSGHEVQLQKAVIDVRVLQLDEAGAALAALQRSLENAELRRDYYSSRSYINPAEAIQFTLSAAAAGLDASAVIALALGTVVGATPDWTFGAAGFGGSPVATATYGGTPAHNSAASTASGLKTAAHLCDRAAGLAGMIGGYERRSDEWKFQAESATKDVAALEQQIAASELRVNIAERELANTRLQHDNSQAADDFLRGKFTSGQLYQWMVGQVSSVYFQSYQLACDLARRAERSWQHELAAPRQSFIQFGYWDSLKKGLQAADKLQYDIKRMEAAYLEQNRREYEITRHVSVSLLDPLALVQLRQTGSCIVDIPEALFDLDYPGHYLRRLKSVGITLPCVTGPYTGVSCTLTLLKSSVRNSDSLTGGYARDTQNDDSRFTDNLTGIESIVTSSGQNDSGLFETNLRDERFLPFEGAGAISQWRLEMPADFRAFDYDTLTDVVLHLRYTARSGSAELKQQAQTELQTAINDIVRSGNPSGLARLLSLRHEYPSEWQRFLNPPASDTTGNSLGLLLDEQRFPYLYRGRSIQISGIELFAKVRPEFASSHNENSLRLALVTGDTASTASNHQPGDLVALTPWNGLLRGGRTFDQPPGLWTMSLWLNNGDRIQPEALSDIVAICRYKIT